MILIHTSYFIAACGGVINIEEGAAAVNLSSPNYPNTPTASPLNCRWTLGAPAGKQIRVTVNDLAITGDDCEQNFLQLRDQPVVTSVRISIVW